MEERWPELRGQDYLYTIAAMAKLRFQPRLAWINAFLGYSRRRLEAAGPGHLTIYLRSLACLHMQPWDIKACTAFGPWVAQHLAVTRAKLRAFTPQELTKVRGAARRGAARRGAAGRPAGRPAGRAGRRAGGQAAALNWQRLHGSAPGRRHCSRSTCCAALAAAAANPRPGSPCSPTTLRPRHRSSARWPTWATGPTTSGWALTAPP
jgi:hypothetical protein